jgi:enamine deaminase RidA (YjgF/YER057c/UK114 family)
LEPTQGFQSLSADHMCEANKAGVDMPNVEKLNPSGMPDAGPLGYSQVAIAAPGRMVFIAGQVAIPPDGSRVPTDLAEQTRIVLHNLAVALKAADATPDNVVSLRVYVVDLDPVQIGPVMALVSAMFGGQAPALTGIGVSALAAPEFRIEIEAVAVVPPR